MKKHFLRITFVYAFLLCVCFCSVNTFAEGDLCELYLPVRLSDKDGNIPNGTAFAIQISAESNTPLPHKTKIYVGPDGEYNFGPIIFDEPGNYKYEINEVDYDNDDIIYDTSVYILDVSVFYDEKGNLIAGSTAAKIGSSSKL